MKVLFTGRHVEVSDALRAFAEERIEKMTSYLDDIIDVHVTLSVEKHRHTAEVSVKTRHTEFMASSETEDMYASLTQTMDKLETQAHKQVGKRQTIQKTGIRDLVAANASEE